MTEESTADSTFNTSDASAPVGNDESRDADISPAFDPDEILPAEYFVPEDTDDGGGPTNDSSSIPATIVDVNVTNRKSALFSRRMAKTLLTDSAPAEVASDASASSIVSSDHISTNNHSLAVRARRISDQAAAFRAQARVISRVIRAASAIVSNIKRNHTTLEESKQSLTALYAAIQANDGKLSDNLRQNA